MIKKVAILVNGGDCSGLNPVIHHCGSPGSYFIIRLPDLSYRDNFIMSLLSWYVSLW